MRFRFLCVLGVGVLAAVGSVAGGQSIQLENGVVTDVGSSWTTVNLSASYTSMVVVATPNYDSSDDPMVVRIANASGSSFDVRVDPAGGTTPTGVDVHYMVVEEGVYTQGVDGVTMEAVTFTSTVTDENNSWNGEARTYANSYTSPVVLGQVMTYNDSAFSAFWCSNGSRSTPPSSSALSVGKMVGEDPIVTRGDEIIGYIVIEAGSGTIDGLAYVAGLGADIVRGPDNAPPYSYAISGLASPQVAVVTMAAMDGNNGGWAFLHGASPLSSTEILLAVDEDVAGDTERSHTTEQVGYIVFDTPPANIPPTADAGSDQTVTDTDDNGSESVTLDGSGSSDSDGTIASYIWEENSSQIATGATPAVSLSVATHTIDLTVTDDDSATDSDSVVITVEAPAVPGASVQLDISGYFNVDSIGGPKEFQECLIDGTADMVDLFGTLPDGHGQYVITQGWFMIAETTGTDMAYSISGYGPGHPLNYTAGQALPDDGVITGAGGREYHMASSVGNATVAGDWTEVTDPSTFALESNSLCVGAMHNTADWQVASVTIELPAGQKGKYADVNFLMAAMNMAHKARNMRITALYGPSGLDEEILYSFSTDSGGSGPIMTDTTAPADFAIAYTMSKLMNTTTGVTGSVIDSTSNLFEFDSAFSLDDTKDLWGFRIEDTNSTLNWAARGIVVFAVTATTPGGNEAPVADAGADQSVTDDDDDGSESVVLDGSASSDADGTIVSYLWEENASQIATGATPTVSLTVAVHTIDLTVTDDDSATDSDSVAITVNPHINVAPSADAGADQTVTDVDDSGAEDVALDGAGSADSDGTIVSYVWEENSSLIATGATPVVSLSVAVHTIELTVTDDDSATDSDSVVITVEAPTPVTPVPFDLTSGFNVDGYCGPKEFQECLLDGSHDLVELFGSLTAGNCNLVADLNNWIVVNSSAAGMEYSISGGSGHPVYLSGTEGSPADGILTGGDGREYYVPGSTGNSIMTGDWTEVADPSTYANLSNIIYVGAAHNINDWQTSSITVELPAGQKGQYDTVNFVLCAADAADKARNMQIVALYGDGTDAETLYTFSTADGGSGPLMTDATGGADFASVLAMSKVYAATTGMTGALRDTTVQYWEFAAPIDLNSGKTLWGFRFADTNPSLNWNARGLVIFAATGMPASGANALPTADAGPDQLAHDTTGSGDTAVTLDGSGSSDSDGTIASWVWEENSSQIATGETPTVTLAVGSHTIDLTVTDNDSGTDSDSVLVDVNAAPVADAGADQTVYDDDSTGDEVVALDGGASTDSDGSIVSYLWEENASQIATGSSANVTLDVNVHTIDLTVTDDDGATDSDSLVVTVSDNHPPVADAGADQVVADADRDGSAQISLNGAGSSDSDGSIVSYAWYDYDGTLIASTATASVTVSTGINDVKLVVTDNDGATDSAVVRHWVYPAGTHFVDQNDPGASDSNDGSEANPWLTIDHAVDSVSAGDVILVRAGIYRERPSFGSTGTSGNPITLMGYPGERVVISGADEITGWTQCTQAIAKNNPNYASIYYADIDWRPTRLAQDEVDVEIAANPFNGWQICEGGLSNTLVDTARTEPDDYWIGATIFLWDMGSTTQYSKEVIDFDSATGTFTISGDWTSNPAIVPEAYNDIYQVQNKVEIIDAAGQWAVEDIGGGLYRVYCWAYGGGDPDSYMMEGSKRDRFVVEWGNGSYWVMDNLELRHGTGYGTGSWGSGCQGGIVIQNCVIHHNDGIGIHGRYNVNGAYKRNVIIYNGNGATNVGYSYQLFEENEIAFNGADGLVVNGPNNGTDWCEYVTARRNYIHDHYRWSHADNAQSYGQIRHLTIEENLMISSGQGFMMEATEYVTLTGNTVIGAQAYMIIFGHSNVEHTTLTGNTLAYAGYGLVNHSGVDDYNYLDNILIKGNNGAVWGGHIDSIPNYSSDYNVFYVAPGYETRVPVTYSGASTFAEYQTLSGEDAHSVQADPLLANAPAYYSALDTNKQYLFSDTRVYLPSGNMALFAVGDHVEIDWDGVVRTVTAVGADYIEFTPGSSRIAYKSNMITNWLDNTDYVLDFTLRPGSPAIGQASDSSDIGSPINIQEFMNCDFNGDGRRDIPDWPGQ